MTAADDQPALVAGPPDVDHLAQPPLPVAVDEPVAQAEDLVSFADRARAREPAGSTRGAAGRSAHEHQGHMEPMLR